VRVIGGQARGRRLKSVPGEGTRPPLARVRQALFDILRAATPGAAWLDLFAGTGSYGIEALSRGAREVVLVELNPKAVAVIRENLESTGFTDRARVVRGDVLREIPRLAQEGLRFDVIGIAPPYFRDLGARVLALVDETGIVSPSGYVYVQRHKTEAIPPTTRTLTLVRDYGYGENVLSFFRPEPGR
jgi:16S rRNA (guanine966-N2)-methyltransferase